MRFLAVLLSLLVLAHFSFASQSIFIDIDELTEVVQARIQRNESGLTLTDCYGHRVASPAQACGITVSTAEESATQSVYDKWRIIKPSIFVLMILR
jgi:hypothetical protein